MSIAVETIEVPVVAIDVNSCKCGFVRGDRRLVDCFSTNDLWS
jgi:hypothetical protein